MEESLILEKILKLIIIMMKNRKNFPFLWGCGKALPALSWTYKCECRLHSVLVSVCVQRVFWAIGPLTIVQNERET